MSLSLYILDNYVMIFELIGLMIMLGVSAHISDRMKKLTLIVVILLFVESILFYFELWTQSFAKLSLMRPILTASKYSIYPIILLFVMMIIDSKKHPGKELAILLVPEIISIPLYFSSQWTHLICWFTDDNRFMGGPFRYWPYIIFGFYGLVFLVNNIYYFRNYSKINIIIILLITIGPFVGVAYYMYFRKDNDYSALFTSAILLYYICIYIHNAKIDPLTTLLNRQSYYQDIKDNEKMITGIVSTDMNDLKIINDGKGHEEGDKALKTVSGIMRDKCGSKGTVYRIGGDEFVIVYLNADESEIKASIDEMREQLSRTPYSCAFGYSMTEPNKEIRITVNEADKKMYEDKAAIKKLRLTT